MAIDLILKDIDDKYIRENFFRLSKYIQEQIILDGQWKFYELEFNSSVSNFRFKHGLTFVPKDVIIMSVIGDHNIYFNNALFDAEFIDITVAGPVRVRFLIGAYKEKLRGITNSDLTDVPINGASATPDDIETILNILEIKTGGIYRIEADRTVRIVSNDNNFSTIIEGTVAVETAGKTVVESGGIMRVLAS